MENCRQDGIQGFNGYGGNTEGNARCLVLVLRVCLHGDDGHR